MNPLKKIFKGRGEVTAPPKPPETPTPPAEPKPEENAG